MPEQRKNEPPVDTPYGPQHGGVDEAAGGADSSPYENEPTGTRVEEAKNNPANANGSEATQGPPLSRDPPSRGG